MARHRRVAHACSAVLRRLLDAQKHALSLLIQSKALSRSLRLTSLRSYSTRKLATSDACCRRLSLDAATQLRACRQTLPPCIAAGGEVARGRAAAPKMTGTGDSAAEACFAQRLQEKVQQQALELSACRSHVVWTSQVALSCEQYCQHLDPSVDLTTVAAALVRRRDTRRTWLSGRRCLRCELLCSLNRAVPPATTGAARV